MRQLARVVALRSVDPLERARQAQSLTARGFSTSRVGSWVIGSKRVSGGVPAALGPGPYWSEGADLFHDQGDVVIEASSATSGALSRLAGDFSFLVVNPDDSVTVVRSVAGIVPWYHWRCGERVAVGSHLGDLVEAAIPHAALDAWSTAMYSTSYVLPAGRSLVRDVTCQPPGTRIRIPPDASRAQQDEYWQDTRFSFESPTRLSFLRHADEMRDTLLKGLNRSLATDGNVVTLSGGVDSSVLASLAVTALGRPINALTFLAPDREVMTRDARYVDHLLDSIGSGVTRRWEFRLTEEARMRLLGGAPRELGVIRHPALCVLSDLAHETELNTLVGGEFADALVGGLDEDLWMGTVGVAELLPRPHLWPFAARRSRAWLGFSARRLVGRPRIRVPDSLPAAISPDFGEEYRGALARWRMECSRNRLGYFRFRRQRATCIAAVHWEATAALGVGQAHPFWSREMLELALKTHPVEQMGPGGKQVLRAAARGLTPAENLARTDKGHGGTRQPAWLPFRGDLPSELDGLVKPDWLPRPPGRLPATEALLLRALLNIVEALRNKRAGETTA